MRVRDTLKRTRSVGPVLFCRGWHGGRLHLAALLAIPERDTPPPLWADGCSAEPEELHHRAGYRLLRYAFELASSAESGYRLGEAWHPVAAVWEGDVRLAYVACNGQEHRDRDRRTEERNALWQRLARAHEQTPINLLLHGGDQLYADEMLTAHPAVRAWAKHRKGYRDKWVPTPELKAVLGDYLFERYLELYSQPAMRPLLASVPSLAIWDDHDICDGWGSRPAEQLDSPVGRVVFEVAREHYLLFQMASRTDAVPAICPDSTGRTLSWCVRMPGLRLVGPDLRSERRPERVLGERGWQVFRNMLDDARDELVLILSSVPLLGPRLSLVESLLHLIPHAQKYEDDLRDQWQSRAHRDEWRAVLEALLEVHRRPGVDVAVLSGEIHLATRGTMRANGGHVHQLVSSGIAHPPPPALYAAALGALARLGESPLPGSPIWLRPLPGRRQIYTAQRNYLMLERQGNHWQAWWELERDGPTPPLLLR